MTQSQPPSEVIVVDASPDWQEAREQVMAALADVPGGPAIRYSKATRKGLPAQRNQGIDMASADILFMIDDDSIMYPDCAQQILRVYAADTEKRIASIGAVPSDRMPGEAEPAPVATDASPLAPVEEHPGGLGRWMRWQVARMFDRGQASFLPYEGNWPAQEVPPECSEMGLTPVHTLSGYRMTFRREVIAREKFVPWFIASAPFEDIDATHRAGRHGIVVECAAAKLHHMAYHTGRLDHFTLGALWVMNNAVLHRLFGADQARLEGRWRNRVRRSMPLEFVKDVLKGRLGVPSFRGILRGYRRLNEIYSKTATELESWYPGVQTEVRTRSAAA